MFKMQVTDMEKNAAEAAELLLAMANPKRLMILCHLLEGEHSVSELIDRVGMGQSALSQQLAKLRGLGLVETRRHGRVIYYRLTSGNVEDVLQTLYQLYCAPAGSKAVNRKG